ncbi:MAG: phenylalanine--tRNA ligase subunit beta [Microthrixaceae bacterium]
MRERLEWCGMRPLDAVVDVSNYVMLELGQPNHTYDLAALAGPRLAARTARDGERLRTLDGVERTLGPDDTVIVDGNDEVIGLAGVMGGASTEIGDSTTDVVVEAAWFDPVGVGATAKRLGLRTEASTRFEKGVDPGVAAVAARRVAQLLVDMGATLHPVMVTAEGVLPRPRVVDVRVGRVNALLATSLDAPDVSGLLEPIGFAVGPPASTPEGVDVAVTDRLGVTVPGWRPDATGEIDIVEEVARRFGYARLHKSVPRSPLVGGLTGRQRDLRMLRRYLTAAGCSETMPMAFVSPADLEVIGSERTGVRVANPLVAEESVLRTSLLPGLLRTVGYNAAHRIEGVSIFELGHCFAAGDGEVPDEWEELGVALAGRDATVAVELAHRICAVLGIERIEVRNRPVAGLHPGRSARVFALDADGGEVAIGSVGEVDPSVGGHYGIDERVGYLSFVLGGPEPWHGASGLLDAPRRTPGFRPISRMPSSDLDLAFTVSDTEGADVVAETLRSAGGDLVASVRLFDTYRGPTIADRHRSLAYRIRLQAADHTLTEQELRRVREAMIDGVTSRHAAELRE